MAGMMGGANHLGMGKRPSESHHWIPGMGWVFMPTFEEGNSFQDQIDANGQSFTEGFSPVVDGQSLADAESSGVKGYYATSVSPLSSPDIRARESAHQLYNSGYDHYTGSVNDGQTGTQEAMEWLNARNGRPTISAFSDVFDWDREHTLARMQQDNYNPFLASSGRWVGEDKQGISELDGYNDDSIAAWFKDQFAGEDMVKHRRDALLTLNGWNNEQGKGVNKGTKRMSQRYFDEMDLGNKFGLTYEDPRQAAYDKVVNNIQGDRLAAGSGYLGGYPGSPGPRDDELSYVPEIKSGGFMESYLKKRAENKPSVMSLMTELKDS